MTILKFTAVITFLSISLFFVSSCSNEPKEYSEYTSDFIEVSIDDIDLLIDQKEKFYLYIGRESCPYCQMFVPKLYEASKKISKDIYYLDIESEIHQEDELIQFSEEYSIMYVPFFIKFNDEAKYAILDIDSEKIAISEIVDFME